MDGSPRSISPGTLRTPYPAPRSRPTGLPDNTGRITTANSPAIVTLTDAPDSEIDIGSHDQVPASPQTASQGAARALGERVTRFWTAITTPNKGALPSREDDVQKIAPRPLYETASGLDFCNVLLQRLMEKSDKSSGLNEMLRNHFGLNRLNPEVADEHLARLANSAIEELGAGLNDVPAAVLETLKETLQFYTKPGPVSPDSQSNEPESTADNNDESSVGDVPKAERTLLAKRVVDATKVEGSLRRTPALVATKAEGLLSVKRVVDATRAESPLQRTWTVDAIKHGSESDAVKATADDDDSSVDDDPAPPAAETLRRMLTARATEYGSRPEAAKTAVQRVNQQRMEKRLDALAKTLAEIVNDAHKPVSSTNRPYTKLMGAIDRHRASLKEPELSKFDAAAFAIVERTRAAMNLGKEGHARADSKGVVRNDKVRHGLRALDLVAKNLAAKFAQAHILSKSPGERSAARYVWLETLVTALGEAHKQPSYLNHVAKRDAASVLQSKVQDGVLLDTNSAMNLLRCLRISDGVKPPNEGRRNDTEEEKGDVVETSRDDLSEAKRWLRDRLTIVAILEKATIGKTGPLSQTAEALTTRVDALRFDTLAGGIEAAKVAGNGVREAASHFLGRVLSVGLLTGAAYIGTVALDAMGLPHVASSTIVLVSAVAIDVGIKYAGHCWLNRREDLSHKQDMRKFERQQKRWLDDRIGEPPVQPNAPARDRPYSGGMWRAARLLTLGTAVLAPAAAFAISHAVGKDVNSSMDSASAAAAAMLTGTISKGIRDVFQTGTKTNLTAGVTLVHADGAPMSEAEAQFNNIVRDVLYIGSGIGIVTIGAGLMPPLETYDAKKHHISVNNVTGAWALNGTAADVMEESLGQPLYSQTPTVANEGLDGIWPDAAKAITKTLIECYPLKGYDQNTSGYVLVPGRADSDYRPRIKDENGEEIRPFSLREGVKATADQFSARMAFSGIPDLISAIDTATKYIAKSNLFWVPRLLQSITNYPAFARRGGFVSWLKDPNTKVTGAAAWLMAAISGKREPTPPDPHSINALLLVAVASGSTDRFFGPTTSLLIGTDLRRLRDAEPSCVGAKKKAISEITMADLKDVVLKHPDGTPLTRDELAEKEKLYRTRSADHETVRTSLPDLDQAALDLITHFAELAVEIIDAVLNPPTKNAPQDTGAKGSAKLLERGRSKAASGMDGRENDDDIADKLRTDNFDEKVSDDNDHVIPIGLMSATTRKTDRVALSRKGHDGGEEGNAQNAVSSASAKNQNPSADVTVPPGVSFKFGQDITQVACDAIVDAANTDLSGGGGVSKAIFAAGGATIKTRMQKEGKLAVGKARTAVIGVVGDPKPEGCELEARYVISAVAPNLAANTVTASAADEALLRSAYRSLFAEMKRLNLTSIAIVPLGTDLFHYPKKAGAKVMIEEIDRARAEAKTGARQLDVLIVTKDSAIKGHIEAELPRAKSGTGVGTTIALPGDDDQSGQGESHSG